MSSLKQIEANRLNSQKSTGPRSPEGKAAVRFNALKSGINAKSQVIPGEDPAALDLLTAEYHDRYQPATPEARALVDSLVTAEWLQRCFRALEAQLWQYSIRVVFQQVEGLQVAQAYDHHSDAFNLLQRRIDAAERSFHRTLLALRKIESLGPQPPSPAPEPDPEPAPDPDLRPPAPATATAPCSTARPRTSAPKVRPRSPGTCTCPAATWREGR